MIVAAVFVVYGLLVEIEALITYRQTGSKTTLFAGVASGMVVMVAAALLVLDVPIGASIGLGVILAMMGVFGSRYMKTRQFFPSGIMMTLSLMTLGVLFRLMK